VNSRLAVIVGAGGVLGAALQEEFSGAGYRVVGLRRNGPTAPLRANERSCDLRDADETRRAVAAIIEQFGDIDTLVCNAALLTVSSFADLTMMDFEESWRAAVGSAVGSVQAAVPSMLSHRRGTILFSGATASVRGSARFAAFAAAKFALRGLAQSLAREYQSLGIHVAHVVIDGVLRRSRGAERFQIAEEQAIEPHAVARTYRWLAEQPASAWTHEIDIRPSTERF
jgi:NADP-dependent 3-hydroxy acid dehydrogenase YdfG